MTVRRTLLGLLAAAVAALPALGASMLVPAKTQAAIFKKILVYDKVLSGKPAVRFLVLGAEKNPGAAEELLAAFKELGLGAAAVKAEDLSARLDDATVVYIASGITTASVKRVCAEKGALSVSGFPGLAENGDVSVAIGLRDDGKPQIIVHLGQLKAEGHEFSAELLKLAKVIR